VPVISPEARRLLHRHTWPGNVRELENCLARATVLSSGGIVKPEHLGLAEHSAARPPDEQRAAAPGVPPDAYETLAAKELPLEEVERGYMNAVVSRCKGNQSEAARILGVGRTTLWRRLRTEAQS
jgi:DNA-binding NtrC family response regulator